MNEIKLQFPVNIDGAEYAKLTMRRSKVKDRLAVASMKGSDEEKEISLFANLCEVSPEVVKELDEVDYAAVQKVYMGFFGSAEMSAGKSSSSPK